ncbi:MAG TPA: metal-dependent hydrolase [Terriglobales bacterium]|nr:metal-dependent hydrolase [Terriglobales bacterium]
MSPVTHFLTGWVFANCARLDTRERALVTLASVVPDVDGLGIIAELLTRNSAHPLLWFSQYHHSLHSLTFGIAVAAAVFLLSTQKWKTSALALCSFHLHLLEDLMGSRGPEGYQWPIPYLAPFSSLPLAWHGQWALNAWPNYGFTVSLLFATLWLAWQRGFSPLEMVSRRADAALVVALRRRFSRPAPTGGVY